MSENKQNGTEYQEARKESARLRLKIIDIDCELQCTE